MNASQRALSVLTLLCLSLPVWGEEATKLVCGAQVTPSTTFATANQQLDTTSATRVYAQLKSALDERAGAWSENVRNKVVQAYDRLRAGQMQRSAYRIEDVFVGAALVPTQTALAGTDFAFVLPKNENEGACATAVEKTSRIEAASFILSVEAAGGRLNAESMAAGANRIAALEQQFDKYLFEGFPMFPWEALANGALAGKALANGPPRDAIVLLHPAAGVVGSVESHTDSDIAGVLSVEPLGWIRYTPDHSSWYGVSLLAVFSTDRNAGYGVAFNYDSFKLGVTWHDDPGRHDGAAVFFGMDLYQLLSREKRNYAGYKRQVREALAASGASP